MDPLEVTDSINCDLTHLAVSHRKLYQEAVNYKDKPLRSVNSLSNPMPNNNGTSPPKGADEGLIAFDYMEGQLGAFAYYARQVTNTFSYHYPWGDMRWGIASSGGGWTGNHVDTCGLFTYIDMIGGMKVWFLLTLNDTQFVSPERFLESDGCGKNEWGVVAIVLRPGERA
jgi:hypothetical protein